VLAVPQQADKQAAQGAQVLFDLLMLAAQMLMAMQAQAANSQQRHHLDPAWPVVPGPSLPSEATHTLFLAARTSCSHG